MNDLIKKQIKQIKNKSTAGIFLDIDDTICATNLYIARLFNEQYGNSEKLSPEEIVMRYRYPDKVPSWQTPIVTKRQNEIFDSGRHMHFYPVVDRSLEYFLRIDSIIPILGYLTGRPDRFHKTTTRWLSKQGFPKRQVIMRPENSFIPEFGLENGFHWKARILESLPNILGTIDDSFGITSYLPKNYPGTIFLYSHGEDTPQLSFTINCPTWQEVYLAITKKFKK